MNHLSFFGGATIESASGPISGRAAQRHRVALLALLSSTRRINRSRDRLVFLLWPDADADRGRRLLSDSIYRINQALGGDAIVSSGDDVRLNRTHVASDVAEIEAAADARDWRRIVQLYSGPFLDGFFLSDSNDFDRWMEGERAQYVRLATKALETLATHATSAGRFAEAADWWQQLAGLVPDDSRVAMEAMRALDAAGNRAGAVRHAEAHAALVRDTIGVEPDRAVGELAEQIARRAAIVSVAAPAADPEQSDFYLQARFLWHRRTQHTLEKSAALLEQTVAHHPDYARAWAGLADTRAVMAFHTYVAPEPAFPTAAAAARRAMHLDPRLAAPHATLALVDTLYHWDWDAAERGFRRAIELEPTNSTAHSWMAHLLTARGRFDEAERAMRRAAELDPLSMIAVASLGWVFMLANQSERAVSQLEVAIALDSSFPMTHFWLALVRLQQRRHAEGIAILERLADPSYGCPQVLAALAHARALAGHASTARAMLDDLLQRERNGRYISCYDLAKVYDALGDRAATLSRLERALTQRDHAMAFLGVDPAWRTLAPEPRFQRLLEATRAASQTVRRAVA